MSNKNPVYVNGRTVVTAASGGIATAIPDVCKTPVPAGPPVPLPYPNTAQSRNISGGCATVKINGEIVLTEGVKIGSSCGNEPGSVGGLVSGTVAGTAEPLSWSLDVKINGKGIVRNLDSMMQNGK